MEIKTIERENQPHTADTSGETFSNAVPANNETEETK